MKHRQEQIIKLLLGSPDYVLAQEIAARLNTGERTVFRDLNELSNFLPLLGAKLEKKHGKGIRIGGDLTRLMERQANLRTYMSSLSPELRLYVEIIYLCNAGRKVQNSELAALLRISESCMSNDLAGIGEILSGNDVFGQLVLERKRSYGISIDGPVWYKRMAMLHGLLKIVPVMELGKTIVRKDNSSEFEKIKNALGFTADTKKVLDSVYEIEAQLNCHFALYDLVLLFCYLLITISHPADSGDDVIGGGFSVEPVVSESLVRGLPIPSISRSKKEVYCLQCLLSSLEPAQQSENGFVLPEIDGYISEIEQNLFLQHCIDEKFTAELRNLLGILLSTVICKKAFKIPHNTYDYSMTIPIQKTGTTILKALYEPIKKKFGVILTLADVELLRVPIRAASPQNTVHTRKIRVLVACVEGICLARLIASVIRIYYPDITIVDTVGEIDVAPQFIKNTNVDVLITTVDDAPDSIPHFLVTMPFRQESFRRAFSGFLADLPRTDREIMAEKKSEEEKSEIRNTKATVQVFNNFTITEIDRPLKDKRITAFLSELILQEPKAQQKLKQDFDKREEKGSVYLEISDIRLFHCRSSAITIPVAGLVRSKKPPVTILYLAASDNANHDEIGALSLITTGLIESPDFVYSLNHEPADEIKKQLFKLITNPA
ncbi:MAG: HTH domain-containing protein [Treponema sp.]|jgi:mannitol/fructose-specific phosphotransferase system IIA component (Ntr-type)|nr:HTH domain-containing protein [Treponema sp.]